MGRAPARVRGGVDGACTGRAAGSLLNRGLNIRPGWSILAAALLAACGGDGDRPPGGEDPGISGAELVVGSSAERWGLLLIPREGGPARLRSLESPSDSLWAGDTRLPPSTEAWFLDRGVVALRGADGTVYRYDAGRDALTEVGRVSADSRWASFGGVGAYVDASRSIVLEIAVDGSWRYELSKPLRWAVPLGGEGVAALVENDAPAVWLLKRGESKPGATASLPVRPPGAATAWGRRLVLAGRGGLVLLTTAPLAETDGVELAGRVRSLAVSPSSHRVYVGVDDPPRILSVNRFDQDVEELAELPRPARDLRLSLLGGYLLAHDGTATWVVPLEGEEPAEVETEWRSDLPLGLPGGRVLVVRDGAVFLWRAGRDPEPVAGSRSAWWVPVRWRPVRPPVVASRVDGGPVDGDTAAVDEEAAAGEAGEAGEAEEAPPDAVPGQGPDEAPEGTAPARDGPRGPEIPPGFYAIVASSQSAEGIVTLTRRLAAAGYPTAVQRHRDEASEVWYRALVGPYRTREDAEASARRLRRERGLQVWIAEIGPGTRAESFEG